VGLNGGGADMGAGYAMTTAAPTGLHRDIRAELKEPLMVIVAGHIVVDPAQRESYLDGCAAVVRAARATPGCLDFTISADLVEAGRINVFERWESQAAVEAFRGAGPSEEQRVAMLSASVAEYVVSDVRSV